MRKFSVFALAALAVVAVFMGGAASPASAVNNLDVHVHANYWHPAGAFPSHAAAQAACMGANPAASCDAVITAGDTVTWIVDPALPITGNHSMTECTDGTFTICGAGVSAANPIDDSGVFSGTAGYPYGPKTFTTPGTYYYRCQIHINTMRGRVVVLNNTAVGGAVDLLGSGSSGSGYLSWIALAAAAIILAAGGARFAWARRGVAVS